MKVGLELRAMMSKKRKKESPFPPGADRFPGAYMKVT